MTHRRLHRLTSIAVAAALGLVLVLAVAAAPVSAEDACDPAAGPCEEPTTCGCAVEGAEQPAEPCEEPPAQAEDPAATAIPTLPTATEPPPDAAPCPAPQAEDGAAEELSPPPLPAPAIPVLPEPSPTMIIPATPTPTPAPAPAPMPAPAPASDPSIRSASPQGSNPTAVGSGSADGGGSGTTLSRPGRASQPLLQQHDIAVPESGDVLDAIEPSIAPEGDELEEQPAPQIALAEPEAEPEPQVIEESVAMLAPPAAVPVQHGDLLGATTRMLGGILVGFSLGLGLLLGGMHLHGRGGIEPPRRAVSPLHDSRS